MKNNEMDNKVRFASIFLYIVCALLIFTACGIFYFVTLPQELHIGFVASNGVAAEALRNVDSSVIDWIILAVGSNAALLLALSVGLILLIKGPFRNREPWARTAIFSMLTVLLVLMELIALQNYPKSPWPIWAVCLLLTSIAWIVSKPAFSKSS